MRQRLERESKFSLATVCVRALQGKNKVKIGISLKTKETFFFLRETRKFGKITGNAAVCLWRVPLDQLGSKAKIRAKKGRFGKSKGRMQGKGQKI